MTKKMRWDTRQPNCIKAWGEAFTAWLPFFAFVVLVLWYIFTKDKLLIVGYVVGVILKKIL